MFVPCWFDTGELSYLDVTNETVTAAATQEEREGILRKTHHSLVMPCPGNKKSSPEIALMKMSLLITGAKTLLCGR